MNREIEGKSDSHGARRGLVALVAFLLLLAFGAVPAGPGEAATPKGGSYGKLAAGELKAMLERKDFLLVNVHIPYEGEIGQTDASVPFDKVDQQLHVFPAKRDAKIVLYCMSGRMSGMAADTLARLGYTNVSHLEGGMVAWRKAGYPLQEAPPAR